MAGVVVLGVALVATLVLGAVWQRRNGRLRTRARSAQIEPSVFDNVGAGPGQQHATIVQFSSAFCQPCVATRRIIEQVVGMVDGVTHVEVDAESHLEAVRTLGIMRTPTVLVLDASGHEVKRASGTPRKADLIAVLGPLLPPRVDTGTQGSVG